MSTLMTYALSVTFILTSFGQSEANNPVTYDTTITEKANGEGPFTWNVRITRQKTDASLRPVIFSMPGSGEVGTDPSMLTLYGPHYWLLNGWDGGVKLGNGTHYPIIITVQQPGANMRPWHLKAVVETLLNTLPIKKGSVHVAGLSQGSYEWGELISYAASSGDETSMSEIKSWVNLEGVGPGDNFSGYNQPYPAVFGTWASKYGGRFFGLEGTQDSRNIWQISQAMNAAKANSAYFSYENIGGGGHCCWNSMYDPSVTNWQDVAPIKNVNIVASTNPASTMGDYYVNPSTGTNIFQWMLRQGDTAMASSSATTPPSSPSIPPPTITIGGAVSITLPTNSATLTSSATAGTGTTIHSVKWSQVSGPNTAGITSPTSWNTAVTGLIAGTYTFQVAVADNAGNTSTAKQTVTVKAAAIAPLLTIIGAQTITLPINAVTISGTATAKVGGYSIHSVTWSQVSGPNTAKFGTPTSWSTTATGLVAGSYVFKMTVTDNGGGVYTATTNVTVKSLTSLIAPLLTIIGAQTITLPTSGVTLSGTAAAKVGGYSIHSVTWSQVSGPNTAKLGTPTSWSTTATGMVAGSYAFKMTVTDNGGGVYTANTNVTVNAATATTTSPTSSTAKIFVAPGEYQCFFIDQNKKLFSVGTNLRTQGVNATGTPGATLAVAVPSTLTFKTAAAGLHGGAAVDNNGNVWTWGDNDQGQSGNGTTSTDGQLTPVQVTTDASGNTFTGVTALAAYFAGNVSSGWYAIKSDGTLWVWGQTLGGMAGNGTTGSSAQTRPIQVPVPGGRKVAQVVAGDHPIVLCTDGTVWSCGGYGSSSPNLGFTVSGTNYLTLQQLAGLTGITQVAGGGTFNYALKSDGTLYGWGYYGYYMGNGSTTNNIPLYVPTALNAKLNLPYPIKSIVTDMVCTHVILSNGTLWGWGDNAQGGIGNGKELDFSKTTAPYAWDFYPAELLQFNPVQITNRTDFVAVFATQPFVFYTYAETADGTLYSWGRNKGGVVGNGIVGCSDVAATYPNSWDVPTATIVTPLAITQTTMVPSPYCIAHPTTSPCNSCALTNVVSGSTIPRAAQLTEDSLGSQVVTREQLLVYPTVTNGTLNVRIVSDTNGNVRIGIYDLNGRMVQEEQTAKQDTYLDKTLSVGRLPAGMYVIQVVIGDRKRMLSKFIKQ
ncbi:MAG TPA: T9SS type A sorting domain-containing protein [Puia sp.]|nr:T9SS type A sorting domain-containing protein [Puia sp.]